MNANHIDVDDKLITVCDKCLRASCWQGIFMCGEARLAGTVQKTQKELNLLNLEHPSRWNDEETKTN